MQRTRWIAATAGLIALLMVENMGIAADHIDAPASKSDAAADITDFYAWNDGNKIVAAVAFAGLSEAGLPATYDDAVLYGIHLDNDADNDADHDVWIRFGQNGAGEWGVQVLDLPGGDPVVSGAVETELDAGLNLRVFAGLRDDPFFFDFDGFLSTLETGSLGFDSSRDSFAGTNVTMIVVEMSIDAAASGSDNVQLWATTSRK